MSPLLQEGVSIEGKGLRYKLTLITAIMSVLPFLVFSAILYKEGLFFEFENLYALCVVFLLLLSLAGMIILRQIFDKFIMVSIYMHKAEAGEMVRMDVQKETSELHEITVAFNNILERYEETNKTLKETGRRLEEQTLKLEQAVTERIQIAGKLWESENLYRELVENINEAIFVVDKDGLLIYATPAFEQISGYPPSDAEGRKFREFIYHEDVPIVNESFQRIISGVPESGVFRLLSKSGKIRWIHSFSRPVFTGEEIVGIQGLLRDITDYREAKKAYREDKKALEEKTREIELLNNIIADKELKINELRMEIAMLNSKVKEFKER